MNVTILAEQINEAAAAYRIGMTSKSPFHPLIGKHQKGGSLTITHLLALPAASDG